MSELETRVAGCEKRIEDLSNGIDQVSLSLEDLRDNHLDTIQKTLNLENKKSPLYLTLEFIKGQQKLIVKMVGWGLGIFTILFGGFALLTTFGVIG